MPATFVVPEVVGNDEGWGPSVDPAQLEGVPYAPYSKSEKVGKVSDFTQQGQFNKYGGRFGQQQSSGLAIFNFVYTEEEDTFHLVDSRPTKQRGQRRFAPQNRFQQRRDQDRRDGGGQPMERLQRQNKQQQRRPFNNYRDNQRQTTYSSSVDIRPEWTLVEQIPFTSLVKLNFTVGEPEDLSFCGVLEYYDKSFDRLTPKAEKPLKRSNRVFRSVTTSDDPIVRKLASEDTGTVFFTDSILTTLMCATRSVYSWDIVVTRIGEKLFFDKRDQSSLDLLTVGETAPEAVLEEKDNINGVQQLALEATAINQSFSQQVLSTGKARQLESPNPFAGEENEELASVAYRYRKWSIAEDVDLVVRSEIDGMMDNKGQEQLLSVKALNELDPKLTGVDWRQKLENQRGAVLATELKNNANKLAKWTASALISGADLIKLGFVSRLHPRDNHNHVILSTQAVKPKDFASQINLSMENCWGIVRAIVDLCMKLDEGKYLLVKDPNKQLLHLYSVPEDAFETNYTEDVLPETEEAPEAPAEVDVKLDAQDDE